jgi:hypothetical protein
MYVLKQDAAYGNGEELPESGCIHQRCCFSGRRTRSSTRMYTELNSHSSKSQLYPETNVLNDFLTSWVPQDPGFADLCAQWETYLKKFQALAKEHKICIVPGTIVEKHEEEKSDKYNLLNVAYFIDHEGEILGKYVKKNLWYVISSISFFR